MNWTDASFAEGLRCRVQGRVWRFSVLVFSYRRLFARVQDPKPETLNPPQP